MSEVQVRYTKDGKKVAVLGKLNSQEWIVQEIFVANGQEFPGGESFITKTLLDAPAETWQEQHRKSLEAAKQRLEQEIRQLDERAQIVRRKATAGRLINDITEKYENIDVEQLDILFAFMSGEITHIVIETYDSFEIKSLVEAVESTDSWYGHISSYGLKLVSLFGCNVEGERAERDRSFRLDWRINSYSDGSGGSIRIYPCRSFDEAISIIDSLVVNKNVSEKLIELKKKYGLKNPSDEKIVEYQNKRIEAKKQSIEHAKSGLEKLHAELKAMETAAL